VADRSTQLILGALTQALAMAEALPLHGSRSNPGLFPTSAAGKAAAARCQQEGWLTPDSEGCLITEKGVRFLLGQVSPRRVLEDLVRVLETRQEEVTELLANVQRVQTSLEGLRANAERVLAHIEAPPTTDEVEHKLPANLTRLMQQFLSQREEPSPAVSNGSPGDAILAVLRQWPTGANEDCSLPELYRKASEKCPGLTVGAFHDCLRDLSSRECIHLHPWTGPLYGMPEPPFALMDGHTVAYYASLRPTA
jgi:hypothetical protein